MVIKKKSLKRPSERSDHGLGSKDKRSRGWLYTVNNYTEEDVCWALSLYEDDYNAKYQIIGFEKGTRKETPHLQCYIYYTEPVRWNTMKNIMNGNHFEAQKAGKNVEAYCYSMEDGDFYEQGDRPRQGNRTDLEVIKHDLLRGKSMKDIANQYFSQYCQYGRQFQSFLDLNRPEYETQMVLFEDNSSEDLKDLFSKFDPKQDIIIKGIETATEIMQIYHSKRYRIIYMNDFSTPDVIRKYIYDL